MKTKPGPVVALQRGIHWTVTGLNIAMCSLVAVMLLSLIATAIGLPDPLPETVDTMFGLYGSILICCLVALVYASPVVLAANVIGWVAGRLLAKRSSPATPATDPGSDARRGDFELPHT